MYIIPSTKGKRRFRLAEIDRLAPCKLELIGWESVDFFTGGWLGRLGEASLLQFGFVRVGKGPYVDRPSSHTRNFDNLRTQP